MSDQPTANPTTQSPGLFPVPRSWRYASIIAGIMVLLALLGVGLTTTQSKAAQVYWMSLVPIYGLLCVWTAWARTGHMHDRSAVVRQILHWVGVAVALSLDFSLRGSGEESSTSTGMNAMLILSLGCFLAGVHLEWLFIVVGVVLTLALIVVSKAQEYVWLIFAVGALSIVAMIFLHRVMTPRSHATPH